MWVHKQEILLCTFCSGFLCSACVGYPSGTGWLWRHEREREIEVEEDKNYGLNMYELRWISACVLMLLTFLYNFFTGFCTQKIVFTLVQTPQIQSSLHRCTHICRVVLYFAASGQTRCSRRIFFCKKLLARYIFSPLKLSPVSKHDPRRPGIISRGLTWQALPVNLGQ